MQSRTFEGGDFDGQPVWFARRFEVSHVVGKLDRLLSTPVGGARAIDEGANFDEQCSSPLKKRPHAADDGKRNLACSLGYGHRLQIKSSNCRSLAWIWRTLSLMYWALPGAGNMMARRRACRRNEPYGIIAP